jgi:carnitine O-acetyltransferase
MPTQVRIFTMPRSLGETLAAPGSASSPISASLSTPAAAVPRSIPEYPEIPKATVSPALKARQFSMASLDDRSNGGVTLAQQDKLPKLPIPDLAGTCQRYLAALKPLQSSREHAETKQAVEEFLNHEGPDLNEQLKKYAEGRTSYIEQFCEHFTT